jgi:SAM-dependent methyltransferase
MSQAKPTATASLGLPRRVARKLLRGAWGRKARHVLDVGCGNGRLVAYLQRRGCLAAGIDESAATQGATSAASIIHRGNIAGGFPFKSQSFDLILVRSSRIYAGDLNTPEAFTATANLLSSLKPRRRAIFLEPATVEPGRGPDTARLAALQAHLACFPGDVDVRDYHDGVGRFLSLEWLLGRYRDFALTLVIYTSPRTVLSRLKLHQQAREAVLRLQSQPTATRAA